MVEPVNPFHSASHDFLSVKSITTLSPSRKYSTNNDRNCIKFRHPFLELFFTASHRIPPHSHPFGKKTFLHVVAVDVCVLVWNPRSIYIKCIHTKFRMGRTWKLYPNKMHNEINSRWRTWQKEEQWAKKDDNKNNKNKNRIRKLGLKNNNEMWRNHQ